jgi:GMP synthase (glutamine-hydrolysing)
MIVIIDCGSSKVPLIEEMVDEFMDYKTVPLFEFTLENEKEALGFIISGAPILITEKDPQPYLDQFTWLKTIEKPVLGICFGHQMMGMTYEAFPNRQKEDRDWMTVEIIADCSLFDKMPTEIEFMEDHCECISIPKDFLLVGVSDSCINEAMMHESKPLFGVQFHPEVSGNMGAILFQNFVQLCENHSNI